MEPFKGFGEAARLYAENLPVIQAMKEAMEADLLAFAGGLTEAVSQILDPALKLGQSQATSSGRWQLIWAYAPGENEEPLPWLTFRWDSPRLISDHEFTGYLTLPTDADPDEKRRLREFAQTPTMVQLGWQKSKESWAPGKFVITFGAGDPIATVAPVWAETLQALVALRQG